MNRREVREKKGERLRSAFGLLAIASAVLVWNARAARAANDFEIQYDAAPGPAKVLRKLPVNDLAASAKASATENSATYRGVSLQSLLDEATASLTVEERSRVDLVSFDRPGSDKKILLPRALLKKFPGILLAVSKDTSKDLSKEGLRLVLPREIHAKLQGEGLLVESLGNRQVTGLSLTSYDQRYGAALLKRRTDPAAMRGEKLYVQNCLGCHAQSPVTGGPDLTTPERMKKFLSEGSHPNVSGVSKWNELLDVKKTRSLASYLSAREVERAPPATTAGH